VASTQRDALVVVYMMIWPFLISYSPEIGTLEYFVIVIVGRIIVEVIAVEVVVVVIIFIINIIITFLVGSDAL
jgi:hypothetical protein